MPARTNHCIIYHIPKTGGTWVKAALKNAGIYYRSTRLTKGGNVPFNLKEAHGTPDNTIERFKKNRLAVTFIRQPVGWYQSYWSFRSRKGARRDEKFPADGLWSDNFDEFVNNVLDAYPQGFVSHLYQFYTGDVQFIGKQERLADDLVTALEYAGEEFDEAALRATPRRNISPDKWKARAVLTPETTERVAVCESWVSQFYA